MYALIDCNNFFVSCERLFRPDLASKPVAVLSNNDGCFVSRSQEAKDIGLPMGAPLFKYRQLVRDNKVQLFSANFGLYGDISRRIVELIREETPLVEVYSIDECFLDISQLQIDDYHDWGARVKRRIQREVGIPVSVGIAGTKTLAKIASSSAKKGDGVRAIETDTERRQLLENLPIEDIWGIGWRLAPKLKEKGVSRAIQLVDASDAWLAQQFSIVGIKTVDELRGVMRIPFGDKHDTRKQILRSRSFGHRVRAYHQLESAVATFAAQASATLRSQSSVCCSVVVFLSTGKQITDESRKVSAKTVLTEATMDTARIIGAALEGLQAIYDDGFAYKKAGVMLLDIRDLKSWQLSLISGEKRRDERSQLMHSIDSLNKKYGTVIWHASEKPLDADWQSKRDRRSPHYTTAWAELPVVRS